MGADIVPVEVKDNKDGGYSASFVTNASKLERLKCRSLFKENILKV